ncbi:RimJ/RimL family protein N-acetyltransferase [Metabacillus crassostreae]|uniref:GNAT family N-acetyltransferase n=1 Tax=Metabacillus crassostreae TaxID=929098 RepID=UPI00195EA479|nr:GNAT family N-acetyltransferase [Metabacillus crassostreae]MBM7605253.1 RimJ/RimL family protein N-acetyltransferase [Metabacillus crassostreae]
MISVMFEKVSEEKLHIVHEIVSSNKKYNVLENGNELRSNEELKEEFLNSQTHSFFIKIEDRYVGIVDYIDENPKDKYPWLGLLMIRGDEQGKGYGKSAYQLYENHVKETGRTAIRIGILRGNKQAKTFWESRGFHYVETKPFKNGKQVDCYQKNIG